MVGRILTAVVLAGLASVAQADEIELSGWAQSLPEAFVVAGSKVEPTYVAAIEIARDGDIVSILGGAPAWMKRSRETIHVDGTGRMRHLVCPAGMDCSGPTRPAGLLSTAALIAAERNGSLSGKAQVKPYGRYTVVCVPAEKLGIAEPILDPCFEIRTGAAIAQKNRFSGRFDGPSLDPVTLRFLPRSLPVNPKDKAI